MNIGQKIAVYLVDDDTEVCRSLGLLLEREGYRTREFHSAESLLDAIDHSAYGVIVIDYYLNGLSGLELQVELANRDIDWPIIFISGRGDIKTSVMALKKGAVDFLVKPFDGKELLASVEEAFRLAKSCYKHHMDQLAIESRCEQLTLREKEVMEYIVAGVSNRNLAKHLGVSTRTIEAHRSKMMKKMAANSLPELVCMVDLCAGCSPRTLPPAHPVPSPAPLPSLGRIEKNISDRISMTGETAHIRSKTASKA
ncbi:MAG: response regulator [Gammaproteobacteria bacterium]